MSANEQQGLEALDVPFKEDRDPSVGVVPYPEYFNAISVIVRPLSVDQYPKFLLTFESALAFKCVDESCRSPELPVRSPGDPRSWAYIWRNSPWVKEFTDDGFKDIVSYYYPGSLEHYVILGGESIIDVLSNEYPVIREIPGPQVITTYWV